VYLLPNWIKGIINPHSSFRISKTDSHLFQIFVAVLCDLIWFAKNKAVHEGSIPDISILASSIRRTSLDHAAAWQTTSPMVKEYWSSPLAGSHKINFDTAIRDHFSMQAAVCRDSNGHIVKALSQINPHCDSNYGEALATQLAASLAASLQLKFFSLEGDSSVVVAALQTPSMTVDWHIESIANTLFLLPYSSCWEAKKVYKSVNFYAHHVAFWAAARVFSDCILTYLPSPPPPPPPLSPSTPICSGKDPPPLSCFCCL
jgi:hypothetical protein